MIRTAWHFFDKAYLGLRRTSFRRYLYPLGLVSLLFCSPLQTTAQDLDLLLKNAEDYYSKEQYYSASQHYQIAVGLQPENPDVNYRLAHCYQAIFDYEMAAHYYSRSLELAPNEYPLALFHLAQMEKSIGNFKRARDTFKKFLKSNARYSMSKSEWDNYVHQAEVEIEGASWAIEQLGKSWREMGFKILPEPVNSPNNDYAAVTATGLGSVTITSGRKDARGGLMDNRFGEQFTDNFRYRKSGDQWEQESATDHFDRTNTKFSDGVGTYDVSGQKYYFTSCYEGNAFCKLYVTYQENGVWKNPILLNDNINTPGYDNKHPTLTQSGDTLIFVSNRPGGAGGNDLWYSVKSQQENWLEPKPLPGKINTPFNEVSPFCFEGNLLFFSSDGHAGIGGMDIFMARDYGQANGSIQNLGTPFNSGFDDSFFSLNQGIGYLSSNRPGGFGRFDIYTFRVPTEAQSVHQYLQESADGTQLRSRIRSNDGSNLFASRNEDQFYYDNLSPDDKARLERILGSRAKGVGAFDPNNLSKEDFKYYNKLDIPTKAAIERLANRRLMQLEGLNGKPDTELQAKLDWEYYQNTDDNEKEIIDRVLNAMVEARRLALVQLSDAEQQYSTNPANRERIESKVQLRSLSTIQNSLEQQYRLGVEKLNESPLGEEQKSGVTEKLAQIRSNYYKVSLETDNREMYFQYLLLSPAERLDLHHSALRKVIINNTQLENDQRYIILEHLGLESDPLLKSSNQLTDNSQLLRMRDVVAQSIAKHTNSGNSLDDFAEQELIAQQMILKQEVDSLAKTKQNTDELQRQLEQYLSGQQPESEPEMEDKIVTRFHEQWEALPLLTPRAIYYFTSLSPGHKLRLDRLAILIEDQTNQQQNEIQSIPYISQVNAADQWYYLELTPEKRAIVDHLVSGGWNPQQPYSEEQREFIAGLSELEKQRIDRMMGNEPVMNFEVLRDSRITIVNETPEDKETISSVESEDIAREPDKAIISYIAPKIYFDFGQYQLRPEARKSLEEMVHQINQTGKITRVLIKGHTDNVGTEAFNKRLGKQRSEAATKFLRPRLKQAEIVSESDGELNPVYENSTAAGRQMNRRVEIQVIGVSLDSELTTYLVKPNVSVSDIAGVTGLTVEQITKWNDLKSEQLKPYQPIRLPTNLSSKQLESVLFQPEDNETQESVVFHTVDTGENLFKLAQRYDTTVQSLEELNNIHALDLMPGQHIRVR